MKKEEFKAFAKKNPKLISYIKSNEMTWQKFYELYDLYGEDEKVWKDYLEVTNDTTNDTITGGMTGMTLNEIVKWFKNVDLDSLQEGIGNIQRVLGVVQDFSKKENKESSTNTYKPRPLYRHFED